MKRLYLVDVSSMFFRAFYAIPPLSNDKGMPTNALYGFLSMTMKLLRDIKPDYIAFCFDRKEPSFRAEIYPEYKANRTEMPEDLVPQVPYVKELTSLLGIPQLEVEGFEADDLIGTLTRVGREHGLEVVIVSADKDFAQLVGPQVSMYDTMKEVRYDSEGVKAKWGVRPDQMIDYLSLVGDSSDNIPGVDGIGPKGAQKLLSEFDSLEAIYENLDKISSASLKKKLESGRESALLSKRLVRIVQEVPLNYSPEDLRLKPIDRGQLQEKLLELGFKSLEKKLLNDKKSEEPPTATSGRSSPNEIAKEIPKNSRPSSPASAKAFLTEVNWSLDEFRRLVEPYSEIWADINERGLFLMYGEHVTHYQADWLPLGELLSAKKLRWKGFDLKEIWKALSILDPIPEWDPMLAAYVVRPALIGSFSEVYQVNTGKNFPDLPTVSQIFECHLELESILKAKLKQVEGDRVLKEIELPVVPVLFEMEQAGIKVDRESLAKQGKALGDDLRRLESAIFAAAGGQFNVASPKQLGEVLFNRLGLPPSKKTKSGYSTDSDVLEKLQHSHPIVAFVLEYRELAKLKSTYVDALQSLISDKTGRVHTHLRQAATTTGRLSSTNPNLQNIPIRTERGREIRHAFIAEQGNLLISADYSQIELRVLAHMSEDPALCAAFESGQDIHTATASEIYGVSANQVTAELRRAAKAVNFGIAYGQGAFGLAESLNISRGEASDIIARYFKRFARVKEYMDETIKSAYELGYVVTAFGRRRYLDELKSKNQAIRKFGERAAINAPIQGTASDLVKLSMVALRGEVSARMLLQVHDEVLFECPREEVGEQSQLIKQVMEGVARFRVPFVVNVASGANWEAAHG